MAGRIAGGVEVVDGQDAGIELAKNTTNNEIPV